MASLRKMIDEIGLEYRERVDWADNLERAIVSGHVKRPLADVVVMRSRHPVARAAVRALEALERWRARLPKELLEEIET